MPPAHNLLSRFPLHKRFALSQHHRSPARFLHWNTGLIPCMQTILRQNTMRRFWLLRKQWKRQRKHLQRHIDLLRVFCIIFSLVQFPSGGNFPAFQFFPCQSKSCFVFCYFFSIILKSRTGDRNRDANLKADAGKRRRNPYRSCPGRYGCRSCLPAGAYFAKADGGGCRGGIQA